LTNVFVTTAAKFFSSYDVQEYLYKSFFTYENILCKVHCLHFYVRGKKHSEYTAHLIMSTYIDHQVDCNPT